LELYLWNLEENPNLRRTMKKPKKMNQKKSNKSKLRQLYFLMVPMGLKLLKMMMRRRRMIMKNQVQLAELGNIFVKRLFLHLLLCKRY